MAASWDEIIHPPEGILSPRESHYVMVDAVESPDPTTRRIPPEIRDECVSPGARRALQLDHKKEVLDKDPRWYEKNILGSGPFKFAGYEIGQSVIDVWSKIGSM